ncbi:unnamed protein product [Haemonchus placei]|uniref:DUF4440 domain-containing protein n=1 Tax=Haemonchus placei TaxID=6290 RepID=A0A3P7Z7E4_HAEPC|nr:unnamed protein product [Haemonchus placei]
MFYFFYKDIRNMLLADVVYKYGGRDRGSITVGMLFILSFLACFLAKTATEDIKAELAPLYQKFEDWCVNGTVDSAVDLYHSQGVMVNKGVNATYGRANITRKYNVMWQRLHSHTFKIHKGGSYQGTDNYKIAEFKFDLLRNPGKAKILTGKFTHIWKKEDGEWRIYHEEYERVMN